jgi:DNA-binding MltR family transcriptional regulator
MVKKSKLVNTETIDLPIEIVTSDDRGCAIVSAAILDALLERLLRKSMLPNYSDPLFGTYGPLGSFAVKIDLAVALGILTPTEGADLHTIRKIRNAFAHQIDPLEFSRQPIVNLVQGIRLRRSTVIARKTEPRTDFLSAVAIYIGFIRSRIEQVKTPSPVHDVHDEILRYSKKKKGMEKS